MSRRIRSSRYARSGRRRHSCSTATMREPRICHRSARGGATGRSGISPESPSAKAIGIYILWKCRAFSSSLGLTAKGTVDLDAQQIDMQGTIVPAYFFNSLLGNIPLVGKLFSPERGGGVFAASYSVSGTVDNPQVSVNPLAALTPGFLRGLFRLF